MGFLAVLVIVAAAGIGSLWWQQQRQRSHLKSVDGFRSSLERISSREIVVPDASGDDASVPSPLTDTRPGNGNKPRSSGPSGRQRPEPLDAARRAAAKRNLERRRASRA